MRFLGDQSVVVFVRFGVNNGNDAWSYRGVKEGKTDSFPATITNPVHITIPVHLWRCGSIHRYSHHLPVNRMSVRRDTETGGRCRGLRRRSDVCWSFFLFFSFFLYPSASVPIDALVSPSTYPVLIHPTQRAENGCKCIFLKGQSH